jgi:hypothetical protein
MASFQKNLAFTPIPLADFVGRYRALAPLLLPGMAGLVAGADGDVGFYLGYRESIEEADGVGDCAIFYALGFLPSARERGMIPTFVVAPFFRAALEHGLSRCICALHIDGQTFMDKVAAPSRDYALFDLISE